MKKTVFAIVLMLGVCFATTSCVKEKSLNGTTWIATKSDGYNTHNLTLYFYESTFTCIESDLDGDFEADTGIYTYDNPVVTLYIEGESFSGVVSGDKLSIMGITFTKK